MVAIAHEEDGVVDVSATPLLYDAALVPFHANPAGINADRYWAKLQRLSQLFWVEPLHLLEARQFNFAFGSLGLAWLARSGSVGVVAFGLKGVRFQVVIGIFDQAT